MFSLHKIIFVLVMLTLVGCGKSGNPELAKVSGKVTLDGRPFTQLAAVTFTPEGKGKMATGAVRPDGTFELKTYADDDGAVVGKHFASIVPVSKFVLADAESTSTSDPMSLIPAKYRSNSTSNWTFEVKAGELNDFQLDMKSK